MRKLALLAVLGVALTCLGVFLVRRVSWHRLELRTYFQSAQGLRVGAPVRLAGVNVGSVTKLRPRPDLQTSPSEVEIVLNTPYELKIPNDAYVRLETAGVLGETFVAIEVQGASGPPATNGTFLKKSISTELVTKELVERLEKLAQTKGSEEQQSGASTERAPKTSAKTDNAK